MWKSASLVRRPMRMAPLFRIMDEGSSGVEKVAVIWRMEALLLKVVCRLVLAIWSYLYGCREQIFLNISKAANPLETP